MKWLEVTGEDGTCKCCQGDPGDNEQNYEEKAWIIGPMWAFEPMEW